MTGRARAALTVLLLGAVAAGGYLRTRSRDGRLVDLDRAVRRKSFQSFVSASGEIVATRYAEIGSSVMGRLVDLRVKEGDAVQAGQTLARIDPVQADADARAAAAALQSLESELQAAEARERDARQSQERTRSLFAQGLVPKAEDDKAQAAADAAQAQLRSAGDRVAQARAQLRRSRDVLAKTEITAPLAGTVTRLSVREGEMVVIGVQNQPGTILMTVSDLAALNAEVKVAEADVLRLRLGQRSTVTLEALSEREFAGHVVEIGASALPVVGQGAAAREFKVVVRLDEADARLRPGLTCDVKILAQEALEVITVPLQAVVLRPGPEGGEQSGVFVVEDGSARFQPVGVGIIGGLDVEVKGLGEGQTIVKGPYQALRELQDGARVSGRTAAR